jgi:hypothetical protein
MDKVNFASLSKAFKMPMEFRDYALSLDIIQELNQDLEELNKAYKEHATSEELDQKIKTFAAADNLPQNDLERDEMMETAKENIKYAIMETIKESIYKAHGLVIHDVFIIRERELEKAVKFAGKIKTHKKLRRELSHIM